MERDGLQQFMDQTAHPVLSRADERALAVRAKAGDKQAFDKLVMHNVRLVYSIARRYHPGPVPLDDLIQDGMLGLIRAAEKFDPDRGHKFSTYAVWWIRQACQRAIQNKGRIIRVPIRAKDVPPDALSLDGFSGADGEPVGREIADEADFTDEVADELLHADLATAFAELPERQRLVLEWRFGLGGQKFTHEQIGAILGVTRQRVSNIQQQALNSLRKALAA